MKCPNFPTALATMATLALLIHGATYVAAQQSLAPAAPANATTASSEAPIQFGPGVEDVLKLSRAKVSDDITVAFIQHSGHRFNLTATDIIYLRTEGVSDRAVAAMLNQQSRPTATAPPAAPQPAATAPPPTPSVSAPQYVAGNPPPAAVYQTAPAYAPASTVYVVSDSAPYYYGSYPYYYGYSYPAFSIGFGFGTGCGYGYGYRGYYGGYYCGNGYRGGYYYGNGYNGGYYRGGAYPGYGGKGGAYYHGGSPGGAWNTGGTQGRGSPIVRSPGGSYRGGGGFSGASHASFSGMAPRGGGGGGGGRRR